jgi:hypothetical protein
MFYKLDSLHGFSINMHVVHFDFISIRATFDQKWSQMKLVLITGGQFFGYRKICLSLVYAIVIMKRLSSHIVVHKIDHTFFGGSLPSSYSLCRSQKMNIEGLSEIAFPAFWRHSNKNVEVSIKYVLAILPGLQMILLLLRMCIRFRTFFVAWRSTQRRAFPVWQIFNFQC